MKTAKKVLVVDRVYSEIKKRILSGVYLPGMHLVEADLTTELNVSRVTLREALRRLVADELVELIPNSGVWVRKFKYNDIEDFYAVREQIEGLAARLVAHVPNEALHNLKAICDEGAKAVEKKDRLQHRRLNNVFHQILAEKTGNRILVRTLERLNIPMIANQFMPVISDSDLEESQHNHEELLEAVYNNDGERAELIMRNHVRKGRDFVLSCFPEENRIKKEE